MASADEEEDCSRQLEQQHGSFIGRPVSWFTGRTCHCDWPITNAVIIVAHKWLCIVNFSCMAETCGDDMTVLMKGQRLLYGRSAGQVGKFNSG